MDHNSGYVWAAYLITGGTLATYTVWLFARLRRAGAATQGGSTRAEEDYGAVGGR